MARAEAPTRIDATPHIDIVDRLADHRVHEPSFGGGTRPAQRTATRRELLGHAHLREIAHGQRRRRTTTFVRWQGHGGERYHASSRFRPLG